MALEDILSYWPYAVGAAGFFVTGYVLGRANRSNAVASPYTLDGKDKEDEGLKDYVASSVPSALSGKNETEAGYRINCRVSGVNCIGDDSVVGFAEDEHGKAPFYADTSEWYAEDAAKLVLVLKDAEEKKASIHMLVWPSEDRELLLIGRVTHTMGKTLYDIGIE